MKIYKCLYCAEDSQYRSNKKNRYCSRQCQKKFEYSVFIQRWKDGLEQGFKGLTQTSSFIRRYICEKYNNTCVTCGQTSIHNNLPLTMQLEHCDGNSRNNKEENLLLLCPNCHTQTEFYGSKNKGRGRGSILKNNAGKVFTDTH